MAPLVTSVELDPSALTLRQIRIRNRHWLAPVCARVPQAIVQVPDAKVPVSVAGDRQQSPNVPDVEPEPATGPVDESINEVALTVALVFPAEAAPAP